MTQNSMLERTRTGARTALWTAFFLTSIAALCLIIPMYVIRPFRPQGARELAFALTVRGVGPWLSAVCFLLALWVLFSAWKRSIGRLSRIAFVALSIVAAVAAILTHVNIFEMMFHPYPSPVFADVNSAQVDADDKVLAVKIGPAAHAYPIRIMGYHHIVNDTVGVAPIAVTFCTLCHTGLVWSRVLDGRALSFRLAGINNGNALMRDEQTGSIWQQSTGQAIFGPLKGSQLELIHSDELTFNLWRKEQPQGLVLKPDSPYASDYETKDWEKHIEKTHVVIDTAKSGIAPHELMLGVTTSGSSKAYPVKTILAAGLIQDQIAGEPVLILVGPDKASMRMFQARVSDDLTFVPTQDAGQPGGEGVIQDAQTASVWNFQGCAIEGKLAGQCLKQLDSNKDYWFDWMNHHPGSAVFRN
jgi:Protein of unknown function (DUF3179)